MKKIGSPRKEEGKRAQKLKKLKERKKRKQLKKKHQQIRSRHKWKFEEHRRLIEEVARRGKNWNLVLNNLHNEKHLLTDISNTDTLRKRFDKLVSEWYLGSADYEFETFIRPSGTENDEDIQKLEEDDLKQQEKNKKIQLDLVKVLFKIEEKEISLHSDKSYTELELRQEMLKRDKERKKQRLERMEELRKTVELERQQKLKMVQELEISNNIDLEKLNFKKFKYFNDFSNDERYEVDTEKLASYYGFNFKEMGIKVKDRNDFGSDSQIEDSDFGLD